MSQSLFISPHIKSFRSSDANHIEKTKRKLVIYHYTSPSAFLSIIKNKEIRFSDIRFMNDKSENLYFIKLLFDFDDKYKKQYPVFSDNLHELFKANSIKDIRDLKAPIIKYTDVPKHPFKSDRQFLLCTSNESDSLNMWNYYVNNGSYHGYNIGFYAKNLLQAFDVMNDKYEDNFMIYYGKVLYERGVQFNEIKKLAEDIEKTNDWKKPECSLIKIRRYIRMQGPFFKNPKFKSENEFRIVLNINERFIPHNERDAAKYFGENNKKIVESFCDKHGLIVPYLKISIPTDAICRITVSPTTEFDIAKSSVKELISLSELKNVKITRSNIPIRF